MIIERPKIGEIQCRNFPECGEIIEFYELKSFLRAVRR
jgi:hypothetical protein